MGRVIPHGCQTPGVTSKTVCAWCGGTPLSREDLLPLWLAKVLVEAFPAEDGYNFAYVFTTESGESEPRTYSPARPEIVVRAVCKTCNNGWMAALEAEVKPFLEPMIRGDPVRLDVTMQAVLARWAAKVVVLLEHYEAKAVILGPTDMDQIRGGQAPTGFHIRLAFRAEDEPAPFDIYLANHFALPTGTTPMAAGKPATANSFSVTLGIGRLAIAIVGGPAIDNPDRWARGSEFPLMIWPPTVGGIEWPPANPVLGSREDLRSFHEGFWTELLNPDFPRPDPLGHVQDT
jgi:hypothetical protein